VAIIGALYAVYRIIPNTRVRAVPAFIAAVAAAIGLQALLVYFLQFAFDVTRYNLIYGALAPIPMIMIMCYGFWAIVLFGCELTHAVQQAGQYDYVMLGHHPSFQARLHACMSVMRCIVKCFECGEPAATNDALQQMTKLAPRLVRDALAVLHSGGFIVEVHEKELRYHPARAPERIRVTEIVKAVWHNGEAARQEPSEPETQLMCELERAQYALLGETNVREFCTWAQLRNPARNTHHTTQGGAVNNRQ
jgi:membrane protein